MVIRSKINMTVYDGYVLLNEQSTPVINNEHF